MISKFIQKSVQSNQQLDFSKQLTISYFNSLNKQTDCDLVSYHEMLMIDEKEKFGLICLIDFRNRMSNEILQNSQTSISWYFPLSKEKYIMKAESIIFNGEHQSLIDQEMRQRLWNQLDQQSKNHYRRPHPDHLLQQLEEPFNCPDSKQIPSNFGILCIIPNEIEHTRYHMPQVVADSRTKFESLFSPYKKDRKFIHEYQDDKWKTKEVNP